MIDLSKVPKKQLRMVKRLMGASLTGTSLKGNVGKRQEWERMLGKAGLNLPK